MDVEIPTKRQIIEYYCSDFITQQLIKNSANREVAAAFPDGSYDKRPNILQYPSDVAQMAKKGITSFHFSVERWSSPMGLSAENYNALRTGWDFVIDIDSKLGLEEAKTVAHLITKLLEKYGIKHYSIKFSGRRGFHIILPWEMFPREMDYKPLVTRYPEIPRILAQFIRKNIAEDLIKAIIQSPNAREFVETIEDVQQINPFSLIEVEKDWGNRHMFRAPFSLNEKTWLVSVPVKDLRSFKKEDATMENALKSETHEFFKGEENEAVNLLTDAMDLYATIKKEEPVKKNAIRWERKIDEEHFPPCIKLVLSGLNDGKKRSIFTLMNFLRMMNWRQEEIEKKVLEWNQKNQPPLPASIVLSQLRYHERRESIPPANCDVGMYYIDIGICRPDTTCKGGTNKITVKNPINYPFRKMKFARKLPSRRGFSCGICSKEFRSPQALEIHKGRYH
ncbi:MAG: hypothetical protein HY514_02005 [Candidatus Aenigmarchaeota archaeon]|nr:hypothetical protein [Candidatus Aenigmarchaeota archaeon]